MIIYPIINKYNINIQQGLREQEKNVVRFASLSKDIGIY